MSTQTSIEWTELTWNPTIGCSKISPGCKYCYAERMACRLQAMGMHGYENGFEMRLMPDRLEQPLKRRKPTLYFVNSMSYLFHSKVPDDFIDKVFAVIHQTPQHAYQILTKRADRLPDYFSSRECPDNAWIGVTVEDKEFGLPRIDYLRQVNAPIRFLSIEPLLEDLGEINLDGIHWVIVGGESGFTPRPMKGQWVENIQIQADEAGAAFFFKQWGGWGADGVKRNKKKNGRIFKGQTWDSFPNH